MGNRVLSLVAGRTAVAGLVCLECESCLHSAENTSVRHGSILHLAIRCTLCTWSVCKSDPVAARIVALNARSILDSRFCGQGRNGIESKHAMLDIPIC